MWLLLDGGPRVGRLEKRCRIAAFAGRSSWSRKDIAENSPCFEGLAAKSRGITAAASVASAGAIVTLHLPFRTRAAVPEGTPLKAVQAGRRNRSVPKKVAGPEVLYGERYIDLLMYSCCCCCFVVGACGRWEGVVGKQKSS